MPVWLAKSAMMTPVRATSVMWLLLVAIRGLVLSWSLLVVLVQQRHTVQRCSDIFGPSMVADGNVYTCVQTSSEPFNILSIAMQLRRSITCSCKHLELQSKPCPKVPTLVWRRLDCTLVLVTMTRRFAAAAPACEIRAHASDTVKEGVDHTRESC